MSTSFVDTHCHIHDPAFSDKYQQSADELIEEARSSGVMKLLCVGTSLASSQAALGFVESRSPVFASVALHPHEVANFSDAELDEQMRKLELLVQKKPKKLVAIGECGLDYYYHADETIRHRQQRLFRQHLALARSAHLPLIFHIRDAFDDFFTILADYPDCRGVVHSFSATEQEVKRCIEKKLYIGLNGIMTFTKRPEQLTAAKAIPLKNLLLETDAPFLTPNPFRGKICKPNHVVVTGQFLSDLRGESLDELAAVTTKNAHDLFTLI